MKVTDAMVRAGLQDLLDAANEDVITYDAAKAYLEAALAASASRGPMSADEFDKSLKALRLTQRAFAQIIERDERTVRSWISGEAKVPKEAAILLRMWIKHNENPAEWA